MKCVHISRFAFFSFTVSVEIQIFAGLFCIVWNRSELAIIARFKKIRCRKVEKKRAQMLPGIQKTFLLQRLKCFR